MIDEIAREPIQSFGVRRRGSLLTEVFGSADEPASEEVRPDAVYEDAGGQRVMRVGKPSRQTEPVARRAGRKWNQKRSKRVTTNTVCFSFRRVISPPR